MSVRVCRTVAGQGACCAAVKQYGQQQAAQGFPHTMANGTKRCLSCTIITRKNGQPGFQQRFRKNAVCHIGPSGCDALIAPATGIPFAPQIGANF